MCKKIAINEYYVEEGSLSDIVFSFFIHNILAVEHEVYHGAFLKSTTVSICENFYRQTDRINRSMRFIQMTALFQMISRFNCLKIINIQQISIRINTASIVLKRVYYRQKSMLLFIHSSFKMIQRLLNEKCKTT